MTETAPNPIIKEMQSFRMDTKLIDRLNRAKDQSRLSKTDILADALTAHLDKHFPESA